jgi:hypothetical protein
MSNLTLENKKNTHWIIYISMIVFLFFFISNINHIVIGTISRYMWVLITILSFIFVIGRKDNIVEIQKSHIYFLILYFSFVFWAIFAFLKSDVPINNSISYLTLLLIYSSTVFVVKRALDNIIFENIIIMLSLVYVLQAISVVLFFFSLPFKEWVIHNLADSSNIDFLVSFRSRGISGSGAVISVYLSFGFFYFMYLLGKTKRHIVTVYSFFGVCLILLAIFLSGRTGFIICAILILSLFFSYFRNGGIRKLNRSFFVNFTILPLILPLGFYLFWTIYELIFSGSNQTVFGEDSLSVLTTWVLSESNSETSTIGALIDNHIVINDNFLGLMFGDPDFLAHSNYNTDSGYLRILNNFGIVGFILYYFSISILLWTTVISVKDGLTRSLLVGLTISLLFVELKEPFLYKHLITASYIFTFVLFGLATKIDVDRESG